MDGTDGGYPAADRAGGTRLVLGRTAAVDGSWITVPAEVGDVRVRLVRPPDENGALPVVLDMHGDGRVLGDRRHARPARP